MQLKEFIVGIRTTLVVKTIKSPDFKISSSTSIEDAEDAEEMEESEEDAEEIEPESSSLTPTPTASESITANGDINGDGEITATDLLQLKEYLVGIRETL